MQTMRGLIPARAGTTYVNCTDFALWRAHPRSRGDHPTLPAGDSSETGSSPLARGPLPHRIEPAARRGLIPARAGTTCARCGPVWWWRAHPRSRGDHHPVTGANPRPRGSSPLARGPPTVAPVAEMVFGLIPARAGTTVPDFMNAAATWAHPRSRGDHCTTASIAPLIAGLIPARAGTTPRRLHQDSPGRAHPRSRGDHAGVYYRRRE